MKENHFLTLFTFSNGTCNRRKVRMKKKFTNFVRILYRAQNYIYVFQLVLLYNSNT